MAGRWRGEGSQHQGARPYQRRQLGAQGARRRLAAGRGGGRHGRPCWRRCRQQARGRRLRPRAGAGRAVLADGLHDANAAVGKGAVAKPELAGMGATLVAAQVRGDEVRWISVGDSPLFLVSAGKLERG